MANWTPCFLEEGPVDLDVLEETALAAAQSAIENARLKAGLSRKDLADRMGRKPPFVSRILKGEYNLTIRTLARAFGACGLEVDFLGRPVRWGQMLETDSFRMVEASPHEGDAVPLAA